MLILDGTSREIACQPFSQPVAHMFIIFYERDYVVKALMSMNISACASTYDVCKSSLFGVQKINAFRSAKKYERLLICQWFHFFAELKPFIAIELIKS